VDRKRAEIEICGLKTLLEKSTEISTNFFFSDVFYTVPSVHSNHYLRTYLTIYDSKAFIASYLRQK
jgi:hypothetical protein